MLPHLLVDVAPVPSEWYRQNLELGGCPKRILETNSGLWRRFTQVLLSSALTEDLRVEGASEAPSRNLDLDLLDHLKSFGRSESRTPHLCSLPRRVNDDLGKCSMATAGRNEEGTGANTDLKIYRLLMIDSHSKKALLYD